MFFSQGLDIEPPARIRHLTSADQDELQHQVDRDELGDVLARYRARGVKVVVIVVTGGLIKWCNTDHEDLPGR